MIDTTDKAVENAHQLVTTWLANWILAPLSDDCRDRGWTASGPLMQQAIAKSFTDYEGLGAGTDWDAPEVRAAFAHHVSTWASAVRVVDVRHGFVNLVGGVFHVPVVTVEVTGDTLHLAILDSPDGPVVELAADLTL